MLALATASLSFNVAVRPSLAVSRVAQPKMGLVADIKDAVLPSNTDSTLRNVMGYQMTGWGVGSTVCPALMMNTLFAANPTGATVWMMRAMGLGMLSLGAKTWCVATIVGVVLSIATTYSLCVFVEHQCVAWLPSQRRLSARPPRKRPRTTP